ncbi:MAG: hypothetical protein MK078_01435 [Crocinitomicaceae bacterium]|nr:hypothetical protein [Crocinitomicaceae bacterium]
MKNIIPFSVVLGLAVIFTACDPSEQFKEELTEIDSLEVFVNDFEAKYESIEFDSLKLMVEEVEQNERDIKFYYTPDTINEELGKNMLESKSIRKKLKGSESKKMVFGDELNAIKHQLINLRADIEAGLLTAEEIRRYIDEESAALRAFEISFLEFYEIQLFEKQIYYTYVPKVNEFIESIKPEEGSVIE